MTDNNTSLPLTVHQAIGVTAATLRIDVETALDRLQERAVEMDTPLVELAASLVANPDDASSLLSSH